MLIPRAVQNAIILLNEVNRIEPKSVVELSAKKNLNYQFMLQIVRTLKLAGWIKSRGGRGGGVILIKEKASLYDVMALFSRPLRQGIADDEIISKRIRETLSSIEVVTDPVLEVTRALAEQA